MYEIVAHTADVRIRVSNGRLDGLFEDAARALVSFSEVEVDPGSTITRELRIESADPTSLLVDFLNELLAILHVDRLAFARFESSRIEGENLEAVAALDVARTWSEDVKAVTYHEADVTFDGELWSTMLVLDI